MPGIEGNTITLKELGRRLSGELLTDKVSRGIYATDASMYQIEPLAVVIPKDLNDLKEVMAFARTHVLPVLPRAAGTSLAGQTVNSALVVDVSKYFRKIIECNPDEHWVRVEPGVVLDDLNANLRPFGLQFPPDPATSSRCGIGGMIANNSSGTKSILYGKTIDHLLELKVLLSDGREIHLKPHSLEEYELIASGEDELSGIYRKFRELIFSHADEIRQRYPKTLRRVSGYPLDAFVDNEIWNLSKLFAGSEGTLGIVTEAKLNLVPLPKSKSVSVIHFHNLESALEAVQYILPFRPAAVELLNADVLEMSKRNIETRKALDFIEGDPKGVLVVEFYGDSADDILTRYESMVSAIVAQGRGYAFPVFSEDEPQYDHVWDVRKKGLGILMGQPGTTKPLAFIEDAAVPVEILPRYIKEMIAYCSSLGVEVAAYAHASVGVIHLRPFLNLSNRDDVKKMRKIAETAFQKIRSFGGSWSSEHGDGLSRGEFIRQFYGEKIYKIFREIKQLFDPLHLLNPHRIIDPPPMDINLRKGSLTPPEDFEQQFIYRDQIDFEHALLQCTGISACRKTRTGTMCPSYMATLDEEHSTRGRANALRMAIEGNIDLSNDKRLEEVFDLCLSCKACKSECPSNVDMARLKAELIHYRHQRRTPGLVEKMFRDSVNMAKRLSGPQAKLINPIQESRLFKWVQSAFLGVDPRRTLPAYAVMPFSRWYRRNTGHNRPTTDVLLFADSYLNYYEPHIGKAIVHTLGKFNIRPTLFSGYCCQRTRISTGFLDKAKHEGKRLVEKLAPYLEGGAILVVCEPSCHSALTDDLPDLIEGSDHVDLMKEQIVTLESYVASLLEKYGNPGLVPTKNKAVFHGHCHQKALEGTDTVHRIFGTWSGLEINEPDSGCCGMAGAFGYEAGHYDVSKNIGERVLFPAVRSSPDAEILASGFSCRHQIHDFTGKEAKHWIELIAPDAE